jgi:hypothetical protein
MQQGQAGRVQPLPIQMLGLNAVAIVPRDPEDVSVPLVHPLENGFPADGCRSNGHGVFLCKMCKPPLFPNRTAAKLSERHDLSRNSTMSSCREAGRFAGGGQEGGVPSAAQGEVPSGKSAPPAPI